jgi:hypothetical protein
MLIEYFIRCGCGDAALNNLAECFGFFEGLLLAGAMARMRRAA